MPIPTANTVSSSVTTCPSAPSVSRATEGNSDSSSAPMAQNQLSPRMDSQTERIVRAWRTTSSVSARMFHPMRSFGSAAGARGTAKAAARPISAIPNPAPPTIAGPASSSTSAPPATVPTRMATNVEASITPLPATISDGSRWSGRIPYFTGPNSAACTPRPNSTASRTGVLPIRKPAAAAAISTTSNAFTTRIMRDLSKRSANWPAVADSSA